MRNLCGILVFLICTSCTYRSEIIHSEPSGDLEVAVADLNSKISLAEERGCRIEDLSLGVGQGLGVGTGIRIDPDCPDCTGRDLNETVIRAKERYALVVRAICPVQGQN